MPKPYELLAVMVSDTSGDQYEIRKDSAGVTYCWSRSKDNLCNAWKFNRDSPKTCKHIRAYHKHEHDVAGQIVTHHPSPLSVAPPVNPMLDVAGPMVDAMLAAAAKVRHASAAPLLSRVTNIEHKAMVASLARALAAYVPAPRVAAASVAVATGFRMITFED